MKYEGRIIRPPNEADSLILQVTVGCSHNRCTFCPAYKEKNFRVKETGEILKDIDQATGCAADIRKVFLCDGDALIIEQKKLLAILDSLNKKFHRLKRIGIYGNAQSILAKSVAELTELKSRKLGIVYLGLESGDRVTLDRINKGASPEQMIEAALRVKQAGIKLNVTVLLGIGGRDRAVVHAAETMRVLNLMGPNHVGVLTLMTVPGTQIYNELEKGEFIMPDKFELLEELRNMIKDSRLENCLFFSNHASNYFPVKARLSKDKQKIIGALDSIISSKNEGAMRFEFMRGL